MNCRLCTVIQPIGDTGVHHILKCNMTVEWHEDFRPFSSREYQPLVADIPMAYASF
ncbi:MAG: hypothetical protein V7K25_28565 [Nostoc sp.]|uniref:hypothetical protein n=1 Tax=Nostoc sp. TaxID=1180 RepID=UPI002FFBD914